MNEADERGRAKGASKPGLQVGPGRDACKACKAHYCAHPLPCKGRSVRAACFSCVPLAFLGAPTRSAARRVSRGAPRRCSVQRPLTRSLSRAQGVCVQAPAACLCVTLRCSLQRSVYVEAVTPQRPTQCRRVTMLPPLPPSRAQLHASSSFPHSSRSRCAVCEAMSILISASDSWFSFRGDGPEGEGSGRVPVVRLFSPRPLSPARRSLAHVRVA